MTRLKRGPIIGIIGVVLVAISLAIMGSVLSNSQITRDGEVFVPSMFEGMFTQVSDDIYILPGESGYFSYNTKSLDIPLLWGVQILDYQESDKISTVISDIFGDNYGIFPQTGPVIFETLEVTNSDTLNFEIQNQGSRAITIVVMLSEDPDNSEVFSDPNSPARTMVLPLAVSGILLILGIIVSLVGAVLSFIDWKNIQNKKRNY